MLCPVNSNHIGLSRLSVPSQLRESTVLCLGAPSMHYIQSNALSREEATTVTVLTSFASHLSEITVLHRLIPTSCKRSFYMFCLFLVLLDGRKHLVLISPSWPEAKSLTFILYILLHCVNVYCMLVFFSKLKKTY